MSTRKKLTAGFCISFFLAAVLAYLLSFGPAVWLVNQRWCPDFIISIYFVVYSPIWLLSEFAPQQIHDAIQWYAQLWQ